MKYNEIILETLRSMGFELTPVTDDCYHFSYEGINYLYLLDEDDENFLRMAISNTFEVTDDNRMEVLKTVHETNLMLKYAKLNIMYETEVWVNYEHYLVSSENMEKLLEHIIKVLKTAAVVFTVKVNGEDIENTVNGDVQDDDDDIDTELDQILEYMDDEDDDNE